VRSTETTHNTEIWIKKILTMTSIRYTIVYYLL
jgi:hypothetical protein